MFEHDATLHKLDEQIADALINLGELRDERNEYRRLRREGVHAEIIAARDASPNGCVRFTMTDGRVVDRFPWNDGGTCAMFVGSVAGEATDRFDYDDVRSVAPATVA